MHPPLLYSMLAKGVRPVFGIRQFFGGKEKRRNQSQVGVQLLGSLLVCYPEVAAVTYDPGQDELELTFVVRQPYPAGKGLEAFKEFLRESLEAFHDIETGCYIRCAAYYEQQGDTLLVHVVRNLGDLFRGELEVMADLMLDRFGESLLVDSHTEENLEPEFANMHSEMLDQILDQVPDIIIRERMAAVRENDRVVVYNS